MDAIAKIIEAKIKQSNRIVISAHEYPDFDAIGSSLAMQAFIAGMGKTATVILPKEDIGIKGIPNGFDGIVSPCDYDFNNTPDLFIAVDCSEPKRICDKRIAQWVGNIPTINIDHHGKELFGDVNYVIKDYSSTGELVYDIAKVNGWGITKDIAEAIWMAVATDTNCFTGPAVRPSTFHCVATLCDVEVRVNFLSDRLFREEPFNKFDLKRRAMSSAELWCNGRVATITLTPKDFEETKCIKQDGERFPELAISIEGVQLAIFFYPFPVDGSGSTRISIRSRVGSKVVAKALAEAFGGGGHEHSAAAAIPGNFWENREKVREFVERNFC